MESNREKALERQMREDSRYQNDDELQIKIHNMCEACGGRQESDCFFCNQYISHNGFTYHITHTDGVTIKQLPSEGNKKPWDD